MNELKIFLNLNCGIHYIYENKGDRYIEYIIKKIMVE